MEVAGANRRWRLPFRCRGSRHESAVAQLFSLGHFARHEIVQKIIQILLGWCIHLVCCMYGHRPVYFAVYLSYYVASLSFAAIIAFGNVRLAWWRSLAD